ncbi:MAG: hypothetical protein IJD22_00290 [Clostridia bacterium]|nr:hypothetical protein [Clostridia bacterium]
MKKKSKTSQLTLGAILLAVFVILHIIVPGGQKVIQGVLMVLTFLPLTVYSVCCGTKKTLIMAAAGAAICAMLLPPEVLLSYAVPALVIGVVGGMCYGRCKRLTLVLVLSVMQLLQNIVELYVYYVLTSINFLETYDWAVGVVYERIPKELLANAVFAPFLEDVIVCGVPCMMILGAGAKGIISFQLIRLLHKRLVSVMGPEPEIEYSRATRFSGKGLSVAYLCAVSVCSVAAVAPFVSAVPYHPVSAAAAAFGILIAIIYFYYFYTVRVRTQEEHEKRLLYSFAMVALLPVNIFALPVIEINLLKKEAAGKTEPDSVEKK